MTTSTRHEVNAMLDAIAADAASGMAVNYRRFAQPTLAFPVRMQLHRKAVAAERRARTARLHRDLRLSIIANL